MASIDVCPTEDAVKAFLEQLVDPLLPAKSSVRDKPSPSQHELVAKQVHSVVLLYNYYHRKQHSELQYLPFNEFCKLAVVLRPSLLAYMKFMQKSNDAELADVEKQLSLPEKMIMDACDVCKSLDASKNAPNIDGWPISKVAVLLTDSKKENCFLLFGSITNGVWSVVEKELVISSQSSEVTSEIKYTHKKSRVIKKSTKDESNVVEAQFLNVGYAVVKEAVGINKADIMHLESYTVYSHSKEKAASRFYIMQCTELINREVVPVPLKDVIESLQGPLIQKSSGSWMITTVVDYFHVLPYSEIISEWISRETFSNSLQDSRVAEKSDKVDSPEATESYIGEETSIGLDSKPSIDNIESPKQKDNNGNMPKLPDYIKETCDMDVDESPNFPCQNKVKCNYIGNTIKVGEDREKKKPSVHYKSNGCASAVKLDLCAYTSSALSAKDACACQKKDPHCCRPPSFRPLSILSNQVDSTRMTGRVKNHASCSRICDKGFNTLSENEKGTVDDCNLVANHSNSDLQKLKILLDSKGKILSQTALTALIGKRNELALQQRKIEDEIAICDQNIQRILTDGEDDIALKIESIIEGCNDIWARNEERTCKHQSLSSPCIKRKKLAEAALVTLSPCQELDGICHENNWVLPTYRLSHNDGGFLADVSVKGVEFQFSCGGDVCSNPRKARDSAAARVLDNLKSVTKPAK